MSFWLIASTLTLLACLAIFLPFLRKTTTADDAREYGIEVYRDQLAELDRDAGRGLIGRAEAEEARIEIARRVLALEGEGGGKGLSRSAMVKSVATVAVLAVPIVSWALYAWIGSPFVPDQPLQARLERAPAESTMDELIARAELHLRQNPEDGRGWEVLAPIYLRSGRFQEAAVAFRNSMRLNGDNAARAAGLGEAIAGAAGGIVTTEAATQFERALELAPGDPRSSYFIALAHQQEGRTEDSARIWRQMANDLAADNPWRVAASQALARIGEAQQSGPAPDPEQVSAAAQMTDAERGEMIEGMVASLDRRLRDVPDDLGGWQRLIRSYLVLGRQADALDALRRGVEQFDGKPAQAELISFAASLGLQREETR